MHLEVFVSTDMYMSIGESMQGVTIQMALTQRGTTIV